MAGKGTQTSSSEPWAEAKPALKTTLADAGKLYEQGVGGRTFTGSMVNPFSKQTIGGMDNQWSVANESEPWMKSGFAQLDNIRDNRDPSMMIAQKQMTGASSGYGEPGTAQINNLARQSSANPYANTLASLASKGPGSNPALAGMQQLSGPSGPSFSESNLANIAKGKMLGGADPYFNQVLDTASRKTQDAINLQASGMGRSGSGANYGNVARELGDIQTTARSDQYNRERGNQVQANQIIDAQRSGDFQNRLGALGSLANTYGQGQNAQLQASLAGSDTRRSDLGQSMQGYGMAADITGRNADRRIGASRDLFDMGQQGVNNRLSAFDRMGSAYDLSMRPGQTMQDIGAKYEDLNQRTIDDQARIYDGLQNDPWNQLARYNAIATGMGGLGGMTTQRERGGLGGFLGGLTSLAGLL